MTVVVEVDKGARMRKRQLRISSSLIVQTNMKMMTSLKERKNKSYPRSRESLRGKKNSFILDKSRKRRKRLSLTNSKPI